MRFSNKETVQILFPAFVGIVALVMGLWVVALVAFLASASMAIGIILSGASPGVGSPKNFSQTSPSECIMEQKKEKSGLVMEVIHGVESKNMKSTEIPNGFVVGTLKGKPALIDFTEDGKAIMAEHTELGVSNWLNHLMEGGRFPNDVFALVHTIKGSSEMLIKCLEVSKMTKDGEPISVGEVATMGCLPNFAETAREKYMKKIGENNEEV